MQNNEPSSQTRFIVAAALSLIVLVGWSYLFPPKKPDTSNTNANTAANTNATQATPVPTVTPAAQPTTAATTPDTTPNRQIKITTPLYEVTLDSKGAVATNWVLFKNKTPKEERPLYGDGSTATEKKPLQLISPEALSRSPRELPFRLATGDTAIDGMINERNYSVTGADGDITLATGQEQKLDFTLTDANGLQVTKSFTFRADNYVSDLQVKLTRNGEAVPNTRLLIGASIGDQAIAHHSFYHAEPEAVAHVNGTVFRKQGASLTFDANNQSTLAAPGNTDWAGVGDAYFAMAAIPSQAMPGLEYRATKYEFQTAPYYDGVISFVTQNKKSTETRHLITAYVPITSDGTTTRIYTGTKDYFALAGQYDKDLKESTGREIGLLDLINFSSYDWLRPIFKPLAIPIIYSLNFFNALTNN